MYEFNGIVRKVCALQSFASGFTKRELVVEEDKPGEWKNRVAFAFKKENVSKLDGIAEGARVKVSFVVDGREWTDPRTNVTRYFNDLTALQLEVVGAEAPTPEEPALTAPNPVDGDIPF